MKNLFKRKRGNFLAATFVGLAGLGTLFSTPSSANAFLIIDAFNDGANPAFYSPPTTVDYDESSPATGGGVQGNEREVRITPSAVGTLMGIPTDTLNIQTFAPNFDVTSVVRLRWDGAFTGPAGPPDAPFTTGGSGLGPTDLSLETFFRMLLVNQNDLKAGSQLAVTFYDADSSSTSTQALPLGDVLLPTPYDFSFASFTGINFAQIYAIELTVTLVGGDNQPFSIQLDQAQIGVPFEFSPGIGIVSLGALFGLARLRNKRKPTLSSDPELETSKSVAQFDSSVS